MTKPASPASGDGRYVRANGLDVYYEEHGRGEEPLILVHGGLITGMTNWGPSIPDFEEHFRVIVPDSRGHGRTQNPTGESTPTGSWPRTWRPSPGRWAWTPR